MTADFFYNIMTQSVIPSISSKMSHLDYVTIQVDNDRPHVRKKNLERLNDFGDNQTQVFTATIQPAQSPELN